MKIMLINSPNLMTQHNANFALFPPIGIIQLATRIVQDFGDAVDVKVIDGGITGTDEIGAEMVAYQPDLVGLGVLTPTYPEGLRLARIAKGIGADVVLGDDHAIFFPELILSNRPDIDYVVFNDAGEQPFSQLVGALLNSTPVQEVPSLAYRVDGGVAKSQHTQYKLLNRNTVPDLGLIADTLGVYASNYNNSLQVKPVVPKKVTTVNFARGCENIKRCTYCSIADLTVNTGSPVEFWSTVRGYHREQGINCVFEVYDSFTASPLYIDSLLSSMPPDMEKKIDNGDLEIMVYARALGLLKRDNVNKLNKLGVRRVNIGLDAGDTAMLIAHRKNKTTADTNIEALKLLNKAGISVHASYIVGAPGETESSARGTVQHIRDSLSMVEFSAVEYSRFIPLPNSPSWDMMVEFEHPGFHRDAAEVESFLRSAGIEIPSAERERLRDKYQSRDLLYIDELAADWFEHFTHVTEEFALAVIEEVKTTLEEHGINTGNNVG